MLGYFDHNATTPLDPRVLDAMLPWLAQRHGNPSSTHAHGRAAREAVEVARGQVADLLGAAAAEVVFTASGTEASNAVIASIAEAAGHRGHLVLATFEHPSIQAAVTRAEARGMTVSRVPPNADGVVEAEAIETALRPETKLVCSMLANNEVGTLQPVEEIAKRCRRRGVPVLCDAVQAVGKVAVRPHDLGVDYLVLGGHKFHGPLGAAALWLRPESHFEPLLIGGGQELGRRSSTENVPALVGLGAAAAFADRELDERAKRLSSLRDRIEDGLRGEPSVRFHGTGAPRLPNTSHVAFLGHSGLALARRLDDEGFAVSLGAACHAERPTASPTLLAMGVDADEALASLRLSVGITTTEAEVDELLGALRRAI